MVSRLFCKKARDRHDIIVTNYWSKSKHIKMPSNVVSAYKQIRLNIRTSTGWSCCLIALLFWCMWEIGTRCHCVLEGNFRRIIRTKSIKFNPNHYMYWVCKARLIAIHIDSMRPGFRILLQMISKMHMLLTLCVIVALNSWIFTIWWSMISTI